MSPTFVTEKFVLSDYPGMRAGRLYAGKPDLHQRPKGEAHLVEGPDADRTLCGRSRSQFPYEFPDADTETITSSRYATLCTPCQAAATP